jgi:hypothetical protein
VKRLPYYKLDEAGDPVPCEDVLEWARWFQENHEARVVAKTLLPSGCLVSTIFLFFHGGDSVLWETMMFNGPYDVCDRYRSREDALVGHEKWVLVAEGKMTSIEARLIRTSSRLPRLSHRAADTAADKKKEQS